MRQRYAAMGLGLVLVFSSLILADDPKEAVERLARARAEAVQKAKEELEKQKAAEAVKEKEKAIAAEKDAKANAEAQAAAKKAKAEKAAIKAKFDPKAGVPAKTFPPTSPSPATPPASPSSAESQNPMTIPANAVDQGFYWTTQDGKGFNWDITQYGTVNDGTSNAYDGGMYLKLNGQQFTAPSSRGKLDKEANEIYLGPHSMQNLNVLRRIYIDKEGGYARFIDLFENPTSGPITVQLEYYSNLGSNVTGRQMIGESEDEEDNPDELIGLATYNSDNSHTGVAGITASGRRKPK